MHLHWIGRWVIGTTAFVLLASSAASAAPQGFVPDKGEGVATVMYQGTLVTRHLNLDGSVDAGRIDSHGLLADFTMGLGHKFAVAIGLPYIGSRYVGDRPHLLNDPVEAAEHPTFTALDNGHYHSTFQDLRVQLRYSVQLKGMAVTPFITGIVPSHSYEYLAHSAVGSGVRELQVGAYAARLLDPWLPEAFAQVGYTHGFEQKIADVPRQRSILTIEGGYFVTSTFRVFGDGLWQVTHGGIDIHISPRADYQDLLYINHDRIERTNYVDLGGGFAWSFSDRIDLVGSFMRTVWGINGHAHWGVLTIGLSYGLGPKRHSAAVPGGAAAPASSQLRDSRDDRLAKCACLGK